MQREAQQRAAEPGFAEEAASRRSELMRRLRRRVDRLQAQLEASTVEACHADPTSLHCPWYLLCGVINIATFDHPILQTHTCLPWLVSSLLVSW